MKKVALVSFDIIRPGEPSVSFSVGSLLAYLRSDERYDSEFSVNHFCQNLDLCPALIPDWSQFGLAPGKYDFVVVACAIWGHRQALSLMEYCKRHAPNTVIIAGGYQINTLNVNHLKVLYPNADRFIVGYAEKALLEVIMGVETSVVLKKEPDWMTLPSPIVMGVIPIMTDTYKIRMETKRGCPFACTFCAQHEITKPKAHYYGTERFMSELEIIASSNVQRVSATDPVFNMGRTYLSFLQSIKDRKMTTLFNFQVRPELIVAQNQNHFLKLLSKTNSEIELGIQTFDPDINAYIKRQNNYGQIEKSFGLLNKYGINYGVTLIYGLPGQTLNSFERDIELLRKYKVPSVVAYPLMLLPGTKMYEEREQLNMKEKSLGEYEIPHVYSSNSFSENEWNQMHKIAVELNPGGRLF